MRLLLVPFLLLARSNAQDDDGAAVAPEHPCKCTGNNEGIPKKQKKYYKTDYGTKCLDWDMRYRYCTNPKSLQEANRACWCPKFWCYVSEECPGAKKSALFTDSNLWYSYKACGNDADACFDEDEMSAANQYGAAADAKEEETTIDDVVQAVIVLTIRVNDIAGTVNSIAAEVSKLQSEAGFDPVIPEALPVTNFGGGDGGNLWADSHWGEAKCPMGYKRIYEGDICDEAGAALGYKKIDNLGGQGDQKKACTYCEECSPPGHRMSKKYGEGENQKVKLLCRMGSE